MSASNYLEGKLLDMVLRGAAFTPPSSVYFSLHTADPTDANVTSTEVSGGNYARKQLTQGFAVSSNGVTQNNASIVFNSPTANWGTISYFGLYDASTGGNLLLSGPLGAAKSVVIGDTVRFLAGTLVVSCD